MSEKKVLVPTVHLNGSSGERLRDELIKAAEALRVAIEAVRECQPNGRDYYPQGDDVGQKAIKEHGERLRKLEDVLDDTVQIYYGVQDQLDARAKR